MKISPHCKN